jgi:hypothetical protein
MTDSLSVLADEVTRVAKVGTEGRLGGVGGIWKDLTGGVNVAADVVILCMCCIVEHGKKSSESLQI